MPPRQQVSVRIPPDILEQLPPPSLGDDGRSQFILQAIKEKLERDKK